MDVLLTEVLKSIAVSEWYEVVCSAYELKSNGDPYPTARFSQIFRDKDEAIEILKKGNTLSVKTHGSWLKTTKDNLRNSVNKFLNNNNNNGNDNNGNVDDNERDDIAKTATLLSLDDGRFCWFGNYKINTVKIGELTINDFIKIMETGKSDIKEEDMWVALH